MYVSHDYHWRQGHRRISAYYKEEGEKKTWQIQSVKVELANQFLTERRNYHVCEGL
jgi:hypothetical protein